jgi:hypothetical protein
MLYIQVKTTKVYGQETKNHRKIWLEQNYAKVFQPFLCVVVILGKGATNQPYIEDKPSTLPTTPQSAFPGLQDVTHLGIYRKRHS